MTKEVTIYGYNSVESTIKNNPNSVVELYVDQFSSNKRVLQLLDLKIISKLKIQKVDKNFLSNLVSNEKHQGIAAKIVINEFFDLKSVSYTHLTLPTNREV